MTNWKFEKHLTGVALNSQFVAKYVDDDERVKLVVEFDGERVGPERLFESRDEYELWIDRVTDDADWTYNQARALNDILNAL